MRVQVSIKKERFLDTFVLIHMKGTMAAERHFKNQHQALLGTSQQKHTILNDKEERENQKD